MNVNFTLFKPQMLSLLGALKFVKQCFGLLKHTKVSISNTKVSFAQLKIAKLKCVDKCSAPNIAEL